MSKYLYLSRLRPSSGQPQSCMDRQLALILGEPWAGAALASGPPVSCLLLPCHRCCFRLCLCPAWCGAFPQSLRTKEERDLCCPVMGAGIVTWAEACALPCLVMSLSGVESWKGALPPPTRMQDLGLR